MVTKETEAPEITFIDNPHAPEVFAAETVGFFNYSGNIHITFATPRINHVTSPGLVNRVVMARIVMPIAGAQGLVAGLHDFLKKQGHEPVLVPDKSKMQ